ncbi:hypothetical protein PP935_gp187 [Rhizobium phage RHph_N34]|uniref:Uncharacterized protein n=1 Tax=Rhizobium phage RHph_N34 TaxID=2509586 RepID=A0A7S5RA81_9CAUD|nr:hypothetical protein PP935_gp187 [Rhizobium phage RHph_N34]QIG73962.1 hypothetical protein EVC06_187 [Rhizobium phage RHph_N34]
MTKYNEVLRDRNGHYFVKVMFRPPMEDMFETIESAARFENIIDANRYLERVNAAIRKLKCFQIAPQALNMDLWVWQVTKASCCGILHEPSKAKLHVVPMTDYAKNVIARSDMH